MTIEYIKEDEKSFGIKLDDGEDGFWMPYAKKWDGAKEILAEAKKGNVHPEMEKQALLLKNVGVDSE